MAAEVMDKFLGGVHRRSCLMLQFHFLYYFFCRCSGKRVSPKYKKVNKSYHMRGARGSLVGRGTVLRVRFPMRSLDFSVCLILPAAL
jgi:hypothetical protein